MAKRKENTLLDEVINLVYLLAIIVFFKVTSMTQDIKIGIISFVVVIALLYVVLKLVRNWKKMKYENRLLKNEKKREEIRLDAEQKREEIRRAKEKKLLESGIDIVDKMSGETFEDFLLQHFKNQGYKGQLTPTFGDYGADLVLEKDGRKIVVQAKRWKQNVDIKAVQEVVGAIKHYDADKGMVITNSHFTEAAYNLASSNGIELWDRNKLIEFMTNTNGKELAASLSTTLAADLPVAETALSEDEICPKCSNKLILRNGKRGQFWGCSSFPQCRFTKDFN